MIPNTLEPEKFEKLMAWLGPDREKAGLKYESIRTRLVKMFYARGCHQAEEMADETMDRVTRKVDGLFGNYEGDPALYFYAVAKKVLLEFSRRPKLSELPPNMGEIVSIPDNSDEQSFQCLDKCLRKLSSDQRSFIIEYYTGTKRNKIDGRKKLADDLGVTDKALRIRAFRIREVLRKCISLCLQRLQTA